MYLNTIFFYILFVYSGNKSIDMIKRSIFFYLVIKVYASI